MPTTYLITGANRGLGKGLVAAYLTRPETIVIAAVRDPSHPSSQSLSTLPKGSSSSLIVVKIESTSETDAGNAISELRSIHNITSIDTVIANAGIAKGFMRVEDAQTSDLIEHFHVNAISSVILFRAVLPLLKNSEKNPRFIAMSSSAGSIADQEKAPIPNGVYGPSKAALNWLVKKIHLENEDLVAFPIHPGWVQTEMGNQAAQTFGLEKAEISLDESIDSLVKLIDGATRESHSGKFLNYDDASLAY